MLRASCVLPEQKAAESSSAVHYTTSALSPVNRLKWLEQVQDDERLGMVAVAVASALARFHNSTTGLTCPSITTIAAVAHVSERAARKVIGEMVAAGHLTVERRGPRGSRYMLILSPARGAGHLDSTGTTAAEPCSEDRHDRAKERHVVPTRLAPRAAKQEKEQNLTDRPATAVEPTDLEVERLARRIQQTSGTPWRLENARRAVVDAVGRIGVEPIRALGEQIAGVGLPAWEVRRRLDALHAGSLNVSTDAEAYAPHLSELAQVAIRLMGQSDCSMRIRWHQRSRTAGASAAMPDIARWVPFIASEFLNAEYPRAMARISNAKTHATQ